MLTIKDKLSLRSDSLQKTREFFSSRGFLETDVAICSPYTSVDAYIDLFKVEGEGYLHSSPELRMKDLLCNGCGDIYFLGHVFRKEENGSTHSSEFTMLEYYRTHTTEEAFLKETIDYLSLFLGERKVEMITYDDAFTKYADTSSTPPKHFTEEEKRHYTLSHQIEPHLGKGCYTILTNFPADEASLAATTMENGTLVAKRFEIYVDGMELGNGFLELSCAETLRKRFMQNNKKRIEQNKPTYPVDETFLANLSLGLPPNTYGIALGFDRILMLMVSESHIKNVIL